MMKGIENNQSGIIQSLLLALLLNLSGHMFLHLSDPTVEIEATHFSSTHETRNATAPQHRCAVCEDHQHSLPDIPATTVLPVIAETVIALAYNSAAIESSAKYLRPNRAPPRS